MEINPGLASVTFRGLNWTRVIELAKKAKLCGIEWAGDVHVPHDDPDLARRIGRTTRQAGLAVVAYGSYYVADKSSSQGLSFATVLKTAEALEAPMIRVWAGDQDAEEVDSAARQRIVDDSRRIADLAAKKDKMIVYEFHRDTLTNTHRSCKELLQAVDHPSVGTYWQPKHGVGPDVNTAGMQLILPWIRGVHIFHWWPTYHQRHVLAIGRENWMQYLAELRKADHPLVGMLEFVKDASIQQFKQDAQTLHAWLKEV